MKLQFLGAARSVTGSMHLLEGNGHRLLLDCGLFQGRRRETIELNSKLPFDAASIDAVVLSHAHLDHSGRLPVLVRHGFDGRIFSTSATRDLCSAMLRDSALLQESDLRTINALNADMGLPQVEPLYTWRDASASMKLFETIEYDRSIEILPGIRLTLRDAGHILGSASIALDIIERSGDDAHDQKGDSEKERSETSVCDSNSGSSGNIGLKRTTLVFTGDLGRRGAAVVRDAETIDRADILITESTYGGRHHGPMDEARERLAGIVNRIADEKGLLIIPAFAVGRTQDVVYHLHELMQRQLVPEMPVYVDSPLATNITEIFRGHPECYDEETSALLIEDGGRDPFGFSRLRYTHSTAESKSLNNTRRPAIIISASGMAEGGRVLHHLRRNIGDPRTTILFVGFQAENTLGRKLLDAEKTVRILGEEHEVKARIEVINAYSAHADEGELLAFISRISAGPQRAFVVHGEPRAAEAVAAALRRSGIEQVSVPARGDQFEL